MAVSAPPRRIVWVPPRLYAAQYAALYHPARYVVIEAATKVGKTYGCMVWLLDQALRRAPGQVCWWGAPYYGQALIAFRRYATLLADTPCQWNHSRLTVTLPNGAVLAFKSLERPDALYGEDVYAAVIDEATRVREEAWHAVRSTLTATQGPVRLIGNVRGRRNWVYRLARRAEQGAAEWHYARLTAWDAVRAGLLPAAEVLDAQRTLPAPVFRQLYLAEPADDEGNPFGLDAIRRALAPLSPRPPVVWGWDLGRAQDWTVGVALDAAGAVCRLERWQGLPWDVQLARLAACIGRTPAWVDATPGSVGDPVVTWLQRGRPWVHGFAFTAASKQQLMERLAVALQQGRLRLPDGVLRQELEAFEYEVTRSHVRYRAPAGCHDDAVCALALAVYGQDQLRRAPAVRVGRVRGWAPAGGRAG